MDDQERTDIERDVYVSLRDYFLALRNADLRRLDERFQAQEQATALKAEELARRLEVLNHAHEQAREKERDFISRETYETFILRYQDAHVALQDQVQASSSASAVRIENTAQTLAAATKEISGRVDERLNRLESFQSKLLGLALAAPFVSALAVYLITQ